ncbi:hypothetical protein TSH58p_32090 (plasmid) [Azospirillum sp. TSH58]|uniref:hemerythrin domain-containing protein n=1 Tax=Azospirillum sp. TSH58 TaxID=664962 RepID=UPI000D600212|nr:hemerythrin domain-containing protein [Azospirillum sp. TSH58]AWJ88120.1 hypothetical protein TSH58p_32090 [Azospirillum sp. TSH58]
MTITQLLQNSPAKANELFAKLSDTSSGAVKTREKLLAELKEELEVQARLEEQHLFPVLKKHRETKDLVADAINDNKQVRALLTDLERTPKDDDGFAQKVTALKKVFQQHVRDERKELLPAVRKALSEEEAQAVTEKLEAGRARIEEAKRDEAEERRAAARREREEAERVEAERQRIREASAALTRPAEAMTEGSVQALKTGGTLTQAGAEVATEASRQAAGLIGQAAQQTASTMTRTARSYADTALPSRAAIQTMAALPMATADATREVVDAWMDWMNKSVETSKRASQAFAHSATPMQLVEVQSRYVQDNMQAMMEVGERMSQIAMRAMQGMTCSAHDAGERAQEKGNGLRSRR